MPFSVWLIGSLATHARGKVLTAASGALAAEQWPDDFGLGIAFGTDFQVADKVEQGKWASWCEPAGRVLLLVPPFNVAQETVPTDWRVYRPQRAEPAVGDRMGKLLSPEVRYEITGGVQVATELGGKWNAGGVHTAYYRKHPHSGLFAISCLPLWSLRVLDHPTVVKEWLATLVAVAGEPMPVADLPGEYYIFRPNGDHFAMMLHLCEWDYGGRDEALATLADSPVLAMPEESAQRCLEELEKVGWATGGKLTDVGRTSLFESRYAAYAQAMEAGRK
jgi:hypothetical protein